MQHGSQLSTATWSTVMTLYPRQLLKRAREAIKTYLAVDAKAISNDKEVLAGERQMTRNRIVLGTIATFYFLLLDKTDIAFVMALVYTTLSAALALDIARRGAPSARRRLLALVGDVTIVSLTMHESAQTNSVLIGLYLWIIVGNGFRFGIGPLFQAIALATAGFALVVATTTFWSTHGFLSLGVFIALLVPTSYSSTLIWKLFTARLEAEQSNKAKSMFLAAISHELRTPLNAIIGSVSLVEATRLHPDDAENFAAVEVGANTLLTLIGNILDLSRIEANRMPTVTENFEIAALLSEVRELTFVEGKRKGLGVSVFIANDVSPIIEADRRHLTEILLNLTSNAVKFTDQGRVQITVSTAPTPNGGSQLRFEVSDTGIGISEAAQKRVFSSFTQEDRSVLDRFGGTGLGLAISKGLANLLGGDIGVTSTKGAGSTFWFTATYRKSEPKQPAPGESDRIIVGVSAEPTTTQRMREMSEQAGLPFKVAANLPLAFGLMLENAEEAGRHVVLFHASQADEAALALFGELDPNDRIPRILANTLQNRKKAFGSTQQLFDTSIYLHDGLGSLQNALLLLTRSPVSSPRDSISRALLEQSKLTEHTMHILVADDNETNRRVLIKTLERVGYEIAAVGDGMQALRRMRDQQFDLVLMDVNMPVLNGLDATLEYRKAEPIGQRTLILGVTADATEEAERACIAAGMDGCLTKPVMPVKLLQHIATTARSVHKSKTASYDEVLHKDNPSDDQANQTAVVELDTFNNLCSLGDDDFIASILAEFSSEVAASVQQISDAATRSDRTGFDEGLHKLRGGAVNVGARILTSLSRLGPSVATSDLPTRGVDLGKQIEQEHLRFAQATLLLRKQNSYQHRMA